MAALLVQVAVQLVLCCWWHVRGMQQAQHWQQWQESPGVTHGLARVVSKTGTLSKWSP